MPRGRPAKLALPDEALLEQATALRLGLNPEDPEVAAGLRKNRLRRAERRALSVAARNSWAPDAYSAYVDCLLHGISADPDRSLPDVGIPPEVEAFPVARRRLLVAGEVARWAYRHRILGESLGSIALSLVPRSRPGDRQRMLDARFHSAIHGDSALDSVYELALRAITAPAKLDPDHEPHSPESIRKAIAKHRIFWQLAEARHARNP